MMIALAAITQTYAVTPGATLNVTTPSGRIAIEAGEPGKIIVVASRSAGVHQDGNYVTATARVSASCTQDCAASAVHGPILCSGLSGNATLGTKEGMVNGAFRDVSHVTHMELGTGVGTVRVVLPPNAAITSGLVVLAGTGKGDIDIVKGP